MKHITTDELRQMAGTEGLILQGWREQLLDGRTGYTLSQL